MQMRMIRGVAASALLLSLVSACQKEAAPTNEVKPATSTMAAAPAVSAAPAPSAAIAPPPAPSASATAVSSNLEIRWKIKQTKSGAFDAFLVVGTQAHRCGPIGIENDGGQPAEPKVHAKSDTRSEFTGPVEGAPWYSATLKDGALIIERNGPETGKVETIEKVPTTATSLKVKRFHMPKPKAPKCEKGFFQGNDNECLKECSADTDCATDEVCEQVHDFSEGKIGAVLGSGCVKQ